MLAEIIKIILLTFVPGLELRASIPYGIVALGAGNWFVVFLVAVLANIVVGLIAYVFVRYLLQWFRKWAWFEKLFQKVIVRTERKMKNHFKHFHTYEVLGLALFIGVPLPGSGAYTGSLVASLLRLSFKDFLKACVLGVAIAGVLVTLIMVTGTSAFSFFVKAV